MRPIPELTRRQRLIELLRWISVLPAALLADVVVQFLAGAVLPLVGLGRGGAFDNSQIASLVGVLLAYAPRKLAFVVAGTAVAPRHKTATSVVLAVIGVLLSLLTHIVGQHLAGNRVVTTNYTHFVTEVAGLLGGMACVFWHARRNRSSRISP